MFRSKQELSTPPGQPLEFRNLSDEEIDKRIAEHEARRRAGE
jgi:adenosyl cobinamide kinase/adenosyl cobinamide phosphate guanylyltransferase